MSRHSIKSLICRSTSVLVLLLVSATSLRAQVPVGWYATSYFAICGIGGIAGVRVHDPETGASHAIEGLPDDLRATKCPGTGQGAASILVRPEDGALIIGEGTGPGENLEIFVCELSGFSVVRTTRYQVGVVVTNSEVSQMVFFGDDRVLFTFYDLEVGSGLGVLDLSGAPSPPVRLFPTPSFPYAVTVDPEEDFAYFADIWTQSIDAVDIADMLETGQVNREIVAVVPMQVNGLVMSPEGEILTVGFGAEAGLYAIDSETGAVEPLCVNTPGVAFDANALVFDRRRGEIVVPFGGPNGGGPFNLTFAAFAQTEERCTMRPRGHFGLYLSGIAINEGIAVAPRTTFLRGDCNADGTVSISDATCILNWLFAGETDPGCVAATNTNGDDATNITDATYLLNHLFAGGPAPVAPYPDCGTGELPEELSCENPSCQ